jgi:hypothetical protein
MTKQPQRIATDKRKIYVRDLGDGVSLEAEVSPCVFMYASYPLQITITLHRHPGECLGEAYAADRTNTAESYTDASVELLLANVRISPCPCCSKPTFDAATVQTHRGALCKICFEKALEAEWAVEEAAAQRKIAARDSLMMRKGMVVRVDAWIHPEEGGDDYQVSWYFPAQLTKAKVRRLLRKEGSTITDDYQIIQLRVGSHDGI